MWVHMYKYICKSKSEQGKNKKNTSHFLLVKIILQLNERIKICLNCKADCETGYLQTAFCEAGICKVGTSHH